MKLSERLKTFESESGAIMPTINTRAAFPSVDKLLTKIKSPPVEPPVAITRSVAAARLGKVATVGHFSPELSIDIKTIAAQRRCTVQALMGEAWDDLLQKHGLPPRGER
jgi:hypothetical protein